MQTVFINWLYLICAHPQSVNGVDTACSLCVFVCYFQVLAFFLDSNMWYWDQMSKFAKNHDPCSICYGFVFVVQRCLTNVWVHKQTNMLPIAIFCISSRVTDQLVSIPGYVTCRTDRSDDQRGGGLCTFISKRLNFAELRELSDPNIESQWFVMKPDRLPRGIHSIIVGTAHHLRETTISFSLTAVLSNVLEGFVFSWLPPIIMPHIDPFQVGGVKNLPLRMLLSNKSTNGFQQRGLQRLWFGHVS